MQKTITTMLLAAVLTTGIAGAQSTSTATSTDAVKNICIANAVSKREVSIINANDVYATAVKNSLLARKDSLVSAWTNGNKEARVTAWNKFKTDLSTARNKMKTDKKTAWSTFETDVKACGVVKSENKKDDKNHSKKKIWFNLGLDHEFKFKNEHY